MKCPHCNQVHPDDAKFCMETGKPISQTAVCPNCGSTIPKDSKFCPDCGKPIRPTNDEDDRIVDLGLSVKWAKYNLGSKCIEKAENLYSLEALTSKGIKDGELFREIKKWGKHWRIPTIQEFEELINNCEGELVEFNDLKGEKFVSKNSNFIFLPAGEFVSSKDNESSYYGGYYWTGSKEENTLDRYHFHFFRWDLCVSNGIGINPMGSGSFIRLVYDESFEGYELSNESPIENGIDLGLTVRWASCNLGSQTETDFGGLYGWADPTGLHTESIQDTINFLERWKSSADHLYGGCNPPLSISRTNLDIATVKLGPTWRIPTRGELDELYLNCIWVWTQINGVNGFKVTGPNGNSIFLPAAGKRDGTSIGGKNSIGKYWSASLCTDEGHGCDAFYLSFSKPKNILGMGIPSIFPHKHNPRYMGFSIRPVMDID